MQFRMISAIDPANPRSPVNRELFTAHVRQALARLHDPGYLETSPLSEILGLRRTPSSSIAAVLREELQKAIQALRPSADIPLGRPEWVNHRLLWMRYVELRSQFAISEALGLSRSSFYYYHQKALEAVAAVLWNQRFEQATPAQPQAPTPTPEDQAQQEVLRLIKEAQAESVDLGAVVASVRQTLQPLAEQQHVLLEIEAPAVWPVTVGNPTILRQILLNPLTEMINLAPNGTLKMTTLVHGQHVIWRMRVWADPRSQAVDLAALPGFALSRNLVEAYGGQLTVSRDAHGAPNLELILPIVRPRTILIVDDNPDSVSLYRRYLRGQPFLLQAVPTAQEAEKVIASARPDLIILDILMPQEDGWIFLEKLKRSPETASIPVIVASVLGQSRLALALGAVHVLCKPITAEALADAIRRALAPADSAG